MSGSDQTAAPLRPVAFGKGREARPRLSKPWDPTAPRSDRYWTEDELRILRENFPKVGGAGCVPLLPRRSRGSIYTTAGKLGLPAPGRKPDKIRRLSAEETAELDEKLKEAWPNLAGKGAFKRFCEDLGIPRHTVGRRAEVLGLAMPRFKEPEWTEAENALLRRLAGKSIDYITNQFREHGFPRSTTALINRFKRLDLSRKDQTTYSAQRIARVLGVDAKTVTTWILQGLLGGERRGTRRLPQQGGDAHAIERAEFRRFVIENLERIDVRKVNKYDFVDLLVAPATPPEGAETP